MTAPLPPPPLHLLRSHSTQISTLALSADNERIYSGDISGLVVATSSRSLRSTTSWKAHTAGILGIQESQNRVITHGRDNKLHVWSCILEATPSTRLGASAGLTALPTPELYYSMDVNSLNFCRFSFLVHDSSHHSAGNSLAPDNKQTHQEEPGATMHGLIALPNMIEASLVDIWSLPSTQRLHASIGDPKPRPDPTTGKTETPTGIVMAMHLYVAQATAVASTSSAAGELHLLCAYENGAVILRRYSRPANVLSVRGAGWNTIWSSKIHVESIMALAVSADNSFALTVSADHLVGRYDLQASVGKSTTVHRTKYPGNAAVAIRDDGRVCAIGGWDGKIRLYSTKTMKSLGTLSYHKTGCQAVVFARSQGSEPEPVNVAAQDDDDDEDEDDMSREDKLKRSRWLLGGGKDGRISIWPLMAF